MLLLWKCTELPRLFCFEKTLTVWPRLVLSSEPPSCLRPLWWWITEHQLFLTIWLFFFNNGWVRYSDIWQSWPSWGTSEIWPRLLLEKKTPVITKQQSVTGGESQGCLSQISLSEWGTELNSTSHQVSPVEPDCPDWNLMGGSAHPYLHGPPVPGHHSGGSETLLYSLKGVSKLLTL